MLCSIDQIGLNGRHSKLGSDGKDLESGRAELVLKPRGRFLANEQPEDKVKACAIPGPTKVPSPTSKVPAWWSVVGGRVSRNLLAL